MEICKTMVKMRSTTRILIFILLSSFGIVTGCNKVDLEDRSKITITGNTLENIDLNKTYEINRGEYAESYGTECFAMIYKRNITFAIEPRAALEITMMRQSSDDLLPEGTHAVVGTECEIGIMAYFTLSESTKALYNLTISAGTMKVRDDNGTWDINFDFTISPASGGGKLTGNFTGTMEHISFR